eukprot:Lankesteria_metandrocarpae@DN5447_c0_g1_i1.p1
MIAATNRFQLVLCVIAVQLLLTCRVTAFDPPGEEQASNRTRSMRNASRSKAVADSSRSTNGNVYTWMERAKNGRQTHRPSSGDAFTSVDEVVNFLAENTFAADTGSAVLLAVNYRDASVSCHYCKKSAMGDELSVQSIECPPVKLVESSSFNLTATIRTRSRSVVVRNHNIHIEAASLKRGGDCTVAILKVDKEDSHFYYPEIVDLELEQFVWNG